MNENLGRPNILFLCSANSARSLMAEAFLRHYGGDRWNAHSAGLHSKGVNPLTIAVLKEKNIDTSKLNSKDSRHYLGKVSVKQAIIVCEDTNAECPKIYPFALNTLYWPFEDPAVFEGSEEMKLQKFRNIRDQIEEKVKVWIASQ